ncbi:MAG: sigma-70 family RNA polymerase sigma factor [Planctomycetia bacterium]|nr:sigma-70 family RNA polymerase sigma factor [Planctomycetia bacterium]
MHKCYKIHLLQEFRDMQIRYLPKEKRLEQTNQAERIIGRLDHNSTYSWHEIYQQITNFQTNFFPNASLLGKDLKHDLHLFIEDLSDSGNYDVQDEKEKIWLTDDLCQRFSVSPKTIARWRKNGLIARRYLVNGKKRLVFKESSLNQFMQINSKKIKRSTNFKRLSTEEQQWILDQARKLAHLGANQTQIAKSVAQKLGRSPETIRMVTKNFDESHSQLALFPQKRSRLTELQKNEIYNDFRNGISIDHIAKQYNRTRGTIYRVLSKIRTELIMKLPLDYIDSPEFAQVLTKKQENEIIAPRNLLKMKTKSENKSKNCGFSPSESLNDIPVYLSHLIDIPLLTPEEEVHLFRKMNYLKYKASKLREKLDVNRPKLILIDEIERLYQAAIDVKNEIISSNLRLVVSIAKKHISSSVSFYELISDGNLSLMKAVEKFDYYKGNKFSTYASWALFRNYARTIPDEQKYRERFKPQDLDMFELKVDHRATLSQEERIYWERISQVDRFMNELDDRERAIIQRRYGLGMQNDRHQTLRQVGKEMGVTKERVRQIETRALAKLRKVAKDEHMEIPELY